MKTESRGGALSEKTVGRLILYRKRLSAMPEESKRFVYSYEIGGLCGVTPAQVRRDLMTVGYAGNPNRGYQTEGLVRSIEEVLYPPEGQNAALVGVGNLGRAILTYFMGRHPKIAVVATFDSDPAKTSRVILGCRCYPTAEIPQVVRAHNIQVAMLTLPATAAQEATDLLVDAGVRGILNFVPTTLRVPSDVYVEDIDLAMALEKVAFFARSGHSQR